MGISGGSTPQKKFKKQEHQRERTAVRCLINSEEYENIPSQKKFGNEWDSPRDGKMWFGKWKERWPEDYPKWMRK